MAEELVRRKVYLISEVSRIWGTFGKMITDTGLILDTIECPWKGNVIELSSVPAGDYLCKLWQSPSKGLVYRLEAVPGRSMILIHVANFGGDIEQGLKSELQGCISLGLRRGLLEGQRCLLSSKTAFNKFMKELDGDDFLLKIIDPTETRVLQ